MRNVLTPDSKSVLLRFSEAAPVYDCHAKHHRLIANDLLNILKNLNPDKLIELGCGTGILSSGLTELFPDASKNFTDGAPGMVSACRNKIPPTQKISHTLLDFEELKSTSRYDLAVSSCALQWLKNPEQFVQELHSLLNPGGTTVHAIPVRGMLGELENSFNETESRWDSLNYKSGDDWDCIFRKAGFHVGSSFTRSFRVQYKSPIDALRAVRGIGASLSGHTGASTILPGMLRKAFSHYSSEYGDNSGAVPATYKIHFITASGDKT